MFKLCFALAFLAVAAAKPNWPLPYAGLDYPYVGGYPYHTPIVKAVAPVAPVITAPYAPYAPVAPVPIGYNGIYDPLVPAYPGAYPLVFKKK